MSAAAGSAPPCSLVIAAFHRPGSLDRALAAVDLPGTEVVVVAIEADPEVVAVAERHGARVVVLAGNPGYGAAVNAGVAVATGTVIAFANDDLALEPGALAALVRAVHGTGALVVPQLVGLDGAREPSVSALATPGSLLLEWALLPDRPVPWLPARLAAKWRRPEQLERVPAAMAALVAGPAAVLHDHPLPECYFLYWEEQEWYWHLRSVGVDLWFEPAARAVHLGGRDDVRGDKSALLARNALRYLRRTQGRAAAVRAWPVVVLWFARLTLVDGIRAAVRPSATSRARWRARRPGLSAAVRGLREATSR